MNTSNNHHNEASPYLTVETVTSAELCRSRQALGNNIEYNSLRDTECYNPQTEVFTERGWVQIDSLEPGDKVASLHDISREGWTEDTKRRKRHPQQLVARFVQPLAHTKHHFEGELFGLDSLYAAYEVTGNHRVWRKGHVTHCHRWTCQDAAEMHGGCHSFMVRARFDLSDRVDPLTFDVPQAIHGITDLPMDCQTSFPFQDWVQFMAYYLSDGNVRHARAGRDHQIVITQRPNVVSFDMEACFARMGLKWTYLKEPGQYYCGPNKALRLYLDQFGKAARKFVPDLIKNASAETIEIFLKAYWQCDGNGIKQSEFYTTSDQMAEDLAQLLVLSGRAASIRTRAGRPSRVNDGTWLPLHTIAVFFPETVGTRKNYKKAFYKKTYSGNVFCLQVPGLGVLLTRLRGKVMWNGNSHILEHP